MPLPPHAVTGYDTRGTATPTPAMPISPIPIAITTPVERVDPPAAPAPALVAPSHTVESDEPIVLVPTPAALPAPIQRVLRPSPFQRVPKTQPPCAPRSPPDAQPTIPPATGAQPLYDWSVVQHRSLKDRERRYLLKVDKLYSNTDGPQRITAIYCNRACASGPGSKTLFFRYYNIIDHLALPSTENDYDHIPCAELLRDTKIEWKTGAAKAQAMSAVSSTGIMNLNTDGSPLTHASAIGGENQA
jgi:hypothetical protein